MEKRTFLMALLVCLAMLGAKAQNKNMYKADTIVDGKGNVIVNVYSTQTVVDGNGNIITRDYDVAAFDEISIILPATVNFTLADEYSCRVTLDENLFECLDIQVKYDCLNLKHDKRYDNINLKPTEFVIEITAPTVEEIKLVGSGDFVFVTPLEAEKLKVSTAGSGDVVFEETVKVQDLDMSIAGSGDAVFKETAAIHDFAMSIAGSGKLKCKQLIADHSHLSVAGSGDMEIESGMIKSAKVSVAGSGSIETRCQIESMDYSIAGSGSIYYYGDVKVKGTNWNGRIKRIDEENEKPKGRCCEGKHKKTKTK